MQVKTPLYADKNPLNIDEITRLIDKKHPKKPTRTAGASKEAPTNRQASEGHIAEARQSQAARAAAWSPRGTRA